MVNRLLLAPFGLLLFFLAGTVGVEARHGAQHRLRSEDKHHPQHAEASLVKRFHPWLDPHHVKGGDSPPKQGSSPFDFGWGFGLGQGTGHSEAVVTRDDDTDPPAVAETTTTDLDSELAGKPDKPKKKDDKPGNAKKKGDGSADKPTDDKPTDNKPTKASNDTLPNPTTSTPSSGCTVTRFEDVTAAVKRCAHLVIDSMNVPGGKTLDLRGGPAQSIIEFRGTTTFAFAEWKGPLVSYGAGGAGMQVIGAEGHVLDMNGLKYWDNGGGVSGKVKPRAFDINDVKGGGIKGLHLKNTPVGAISVNGGTDFTVERCNVDSGDGDRRGGRNTDAVGVANSQGVKIINNVMHNQDDCVVVLPSTGTIVEGNHCIGSHGISITPMEGDVRDVTVRGNTVEGGDNGLRIKASKGSKGSVSGVKFISNTIHSIKEFGVVVQTNYPDRIEKMGESKIAAPSSANTITDITFQDIKGDVASSAVPVAVMCGPGNCHDWTWSNVSISGGHKFACSGAPRGVCGSDQDQDE